MRNLDDEAATLGNGEVGRPDCICNETAEKDCGRFALSLKHDVKPFSVDIPEAQLDDLMSRLKRTRFPDDFANDDWRYGYNTAYHRELIN